MPPARREKRRTSFSASEKLTVARAVEECKGVSKVISDPEVSSTLEQQCAVQELQQQREPESGISTRLPLEAELAGRGSSRVAEGRGGGSTPSICNKLFMRARTCASKKTFEALEDIAEAFVANVGGTMLDLGIKKSTTRIKQGTELQFLSYQDLYCGGPETV
ncbi:hypothetical protein ON010_g611 [Phytophthora cinnamomi]|nr:hypothetical protein ON010_g611 [Phytophthora cinnamomi]